MENSKPSRSYLSVFFIALLVRSSSLLSQTYFQPDEFYQSLEPAHFLVFGYGQLTWEWCDLPTPSHEMMKGWGAAKRWLVKCGGGRLRGWLWPSLFAGIYWLLKELQLDNSWWLIISPRIPLVLIAAATDYYTYLFAHKIIGPSSANAALFLSLTNIFHFHALPRALSTSAETFLTTFSLYHWPLPQTHGGAGNEEWGLVVSLAASAMSFVIRPTGGVLWVFLGLELAWRSWRVTGLRGTVKLLGLVALTGSSVVGLSTLLDYCLTGILYFPTLAFLTQNLILNISAFYGSNPWHYHLFQSLPILLTNSLPFFVPGFVRTLLSHSERADRKNDPPKGLRILAWASIWTIAVWSAIPHKEWRFLHPLLPLLLLFPTYHLTTTYETNPLRSPSVSLIERIRHSVGMNKSPFLLLLLTPVLPAIYLSCFHGRAQISVTEFLRTGEGKRGVAVLMPCHSIPGMSHIHREGLGRGGMWHLSCEPPIGMANKSEYRTEEQLFYQDPYGGVAKLIDNEFRTGDILVFGSLLDEVESAEAPERTISSLLRDKGYQEVWRAWNGFDFLQDEENRRGGVRVWSVDGH